MWLLIPGLLMFGSPKPVAGPEPVEFAVSDLQHAGDTVTPEAAGVRLRVKSTKGIGRCTITPKKGAWPEQVTVLLEGLNELEHFELATGRMFADGSRGSSGEFTLSLLGKDRDAAKRSRVGTLDIKVERRKDGIAVIFPAKLLADSDAVSIAWIDWYRR